MSHSYTYDSAVVFTVQRMMHDIVIPKLSLLSDNHINVDYKREFKEQLNVCTELGLTLSENELLYLCDTYPNRNKMQIRFSNLKRAKFKEVS